MRRLFISLALCLLPVVSPAQQSYWRDAHGAPIADTDTRKSKDGFAGWLLVTPDEDWQAKWETPSSVVPIFNEAKDVSRGKRLFILTFFANPELNSDREANVTCDLKVVRPDGSTSVNEQNAACFQGRLMGDQFNLYLSAPVLVFTGEAADPLGTWKVTVTLEDNRRQVTLSLSTSFVLQ